MNSRLPLAGSACCILTMLAPDPAMSQPSMTDLHDDGFVLSGDLNQPTLHNNSNRRVIAYTLRVERNGNPVPMTVVREALLPIRNEAFYKTQNYPHTPESISLPAGGSQPIKFNDKTNVATASNRWRWMLWSSKTENWLVPTKATP